MRKLCCLKIPQKSNASTLIKLELLGFLNPVVTEKRIRILLIFFYKITPFITVLKQVPQNNI